MSGISEKGPSQFPKAEGKHLQIACFVWPKSKDMQFTITQYKEKQQILTT